MILWFDQTRSCAISISRFHLCHYQREQQAIHSISTSIFGFTRPVITVERAGLLFAKILNNLTHLAKNEICKGKKKPTKHLINLKNGSTIHSLPAGDTGYGIMGFTIDLLIADEAAWIPEEVWNSIIPALAITRGEIWLLSTPFIKSGYYYDCFNNPAFTSFHTSSEDCPRKDEAFLKMKM